MKKFIPLAFAVGFVAFGDWLAGLALAVLALIWIALPAEEGPPVLALATTMQWVSVSVGLFYYLVAGRQVDAISKTDYRTMTLLGLGCVAATAVGLAMGRELIQRWRQPQGLRPANALSFKTLIVVYVVFTLSLSITHNIDFGGFAMAVVALGYLRLGLLYLVFRRLIRNHDWHYLLLLLAVEVVLGITGFYAGFREPLIMAALAFLEFFDRRSVRQWASLGVIGVMMVTLGVVWIGVRVDYRGKWMSDDRFSASRGARVDALRESVNAWASQSSEDMWSNIDAFVDRMWTIYYPALAVERVPTVLAHTDGALMADTLRFVFEPRIFFPDKPYIVSDSQMVRKYSGVAVAGEEQDTDIAFGYAAESYVDFGVPGMFVPAFIWALFIGIATELIFREYHHRDMAISVVTVIGWMSLYLFERSWAKTIGIGGSLLIYAGGLCYFLDSLWFQKFKNLYLGGVDQAGETIEVEPDADVPGAAAPDADASPIHLHPQPHSK